MRQRAALPALIAALLALPALVQANTYTVVINTSLSWTQAQTAANLAGGYLATITSPAEQAAVNAAIAAASPPQNGGFWIGLRETSECCYVWDDGEGSCYSNFYPAEPNNGAPGEDRGQIMWNLSDPTRRGFWNDVPDSGRAGTLDISRGGYVIEFGSPDPAAGPCGACLRVSPSSFCNSPPGGAVIVATQVSGVSTSPPLSVAAVRTVTRTIIDAEPPTRPSRARPMIFGTTLTINVPVPATGVSAGTVASAFIDSINRVAGSRGFVANYLTISDSTVLRMYRVGSYSYNDVNTVPGITVAPYSGGGGGGGAQGPIAAWPAQALLVVIFSALAARAMRARRRADA